MPVILSLVPLAVIGVLYVWYLRIAARWTLKISLSRKLAWLFVAVVLLVAIAVRLVLPAGTGPLASILGVAAHLGFGTYYFGNFAVDKNGDRPGVSGGLKITAAAMGLLLATVAALFGVALVLQMSMAMG